MSATSALFERWKAAKGITSEREAMKRLGLSPGAAQHWKAGRNATVEVIERMCKDLGEDYVLVVMQAFEETATSEPERRVWKKIAKRVGSAAIALVLSVPLAPSTSSAAPSSAERNAQGVYIMRST